MAEGLKPCPICKSTVLTMKRYPYEFKEPEYTRMCASCWFECPELLWNKLPRRSGKWVKCSKRLPDEERCYLVVLKSTRTMSLAAPFLDYREDRGTWVGTGGSIKNKGDIIAWYDGDVLADLGWET